MNMHRKSMRYHDIVSEIMCGKLSIKDWEEATIIWNSSHVRYAQHKINRKRLHPEEPLWPRLAIIFFFSYSLLSFNCNPYIFVIPPYLESCLLSSTHLFSGFLCISFEWLRDCLFECTKGIQIVIFEEMNKFPRKLHI